jgi:hypothetical protein
MVAALGSLEGYKLDAYFRQSSRNLPFVAVAQRDVTTSPLGYGRLQLAADSARCYGSLPLSFSHAKTCWADALERAYSVTARGSPEEVATACRRHLRNLIAQYSVAVFVFQVTPIPAVMHFPSIHGGSPFLHASSQNGDHACKQRVLAPTRSAMGSAALGYDDCTFSKLCRRLNPLHDLSGCI